MSSEPDEKNEGPDVQPVDRFEVAQYALRAAFYYRAHRLWESLCELLSAQDHDRDWTEAEQFGISRHAAERVTELGIPRSEVFVHPSLLLAEPRLIRYFRCLALLPQKGTQRIAVKMG